MKSVQYIFLSIFSFLFLISGGVSIAQSANPHLPVQDSRYAAQYVTQSDSDPIVIPAGSTKEVSVTFKNTGTATWESDSGAYFTAYTVNPKYRISKFANTNWIGKTQPAKMNAITAPGANGTITLSITAPTTPGTYTEEFYLAANNYTWVDGGYFYLKFVVSPAESTSTGVAPKPVEKSVVEANSRISKVYISRSVVEEVGGVEKEIRFAVRNTANEPMKNFRIVPVSSADAMFAHADWLGADTIMEAEAALEPNAVYRRDMLLRTPAKAGIYQFSFAVTDENGIISGSTFELPVTVTKDAPANYEAPRFAIKADPIQFRFAEEPTIRVGLAKIASGSMTAKPLSGAYEVFAGNVRIAELPKGTVATLSFEGNKYTYTDSNTSFMSKQYIRLVPTSEEENSLIELGGGFERDIIWKGQRDFTQYRGVVELRQAEDSEKTLYAINELGLEDYTAGVAEASNSAPTAFLEAQAVVSRTYALFSKQIQKYTDRYFDVVAHTGDQLYLGFTIEQLAPKYLAAVERTRGKVVTYEDAIVITPYFGNSDGTTRNFDDVWGGAMKPWLVSVSAEYDRGRRLYGHGVGMSQRDAMERATVEQSSYMDLISHYYTGIEIEELYQ